MSRSSGPSDYNTRVSIPSQEEYEWLNAIREELGLTWRGMMLKAEQRLLAAERHWPASLQSDHLVPAAEGAGDEDEAETEGDAEADLETEEMSG
jgi:hypothetical protein